MSTDKKRLSKAIGRRIKEKRNERGLTQSQIAESLEVSDQYISQIESGKVNLSLNRLVDISDLLDESLSFLINGINGDNSISEKISRLNTRDLRIVENLINDLLSDQ